MTAMQQLITIAVVAAVTVALRALPFLVFSGERKPPAFVLWLGGQLPRAVMALLVIYCLKDGIAGDAPGLLPAVAAVGTTVALHLWKKQMILSVAGGTLCYMLLVQFAA